MEKDRATFFTFVQKTRETRLLTLEDKLAVLVFFLTDYEKAATAALMQMIRKRITDLEAQHAKVVDEIADIKVSICGPGIEPTDVRSS